MGRGVLPSNERNEGSPDRTSCLKLIGCGCERVQYPESASEVRGYVWRCGFGGEGDEGGGVLMGLGRGRVSYLVWDWRSVFSVAYTGLWLMCRAVVLSEFEVYFLRRQDVYLSWSCFLISGCFSHTSYAIRSILVGVRQVRSRRDVCVPSEYQGEEVRSGCLLGLDWIYFCFLLEACTRLWSISRHRAF